MSTYWRSRTVACWHNQEQYAGSVTALLNISIPVLHLTHFLPSRGCLYSMLTVPSAKQVLISRTERPIYLKVSWDYVSNKPNTPSGDKEQLQTSCLARSPYVWSWRSLYWPPNNWAMYLPRDLMIWSSLAVPFLVTPPFFDFRGLMYHPGTMWQRSVTCALLFTRFPWQSSSSSNTSAQILSSSF